MEAKHSAGESHPVGHQISAAEYRHKLGNNRLGLWLFIISDAFVFGGLLISRFNLMGDTRPELLQPLGLVVTVMLLASSVLMNRAELSMAAGQVKHFLNYTLGTIILGTLFLVGVVFVEWPLASAHGIAANTVGGSLFYTMTGFHAFHVLTGVIFLFIVWRNGRKGIYSRERHWGVEAAAVYWHFVDVVWVFFYPALYLIGVPVV